MSRNSLNRAEIERSIMEGRHGRPTPPPEGTPPPDDWWTFEAVEERLIEAWDFLARMPDREAGWQRAGLSSLYRSIVREWNDYWQTDDHPPRLGLRSTEVDRMEQALDWLQHVRPADRRLIGLALHALSRGAAEVPWRGLCKPMAWGGHPDALRKRYSRSLTRVVMTLNAAEKRDGMVSSHGIQREGE